MVRLKPHRRVKALKDYSLRGYYVVYSGRYVPTFRSNLQPPASESKLKMAVERFSATLVPLYKTSLRHIQIIVMLMVTFSHIRHPTERNIALIYRTTWRYQAGLCNGIALDSYLKGVWFELLLKHL